MKIKNILASVVLILALLTGGISIAGAFPGQTMACNGCHTLSPSIIVSTNITSLTVNPNQIFTVGITYSGGLATGAGPETEVNWPTDFSNIGLSNISNSLFNPTPRIPAPAGAASSGTASSVLTAPAVPGTYTLRVYTSSGTNMAPDGTNFAEITVAVATPTPTPTTSPTPTPAPPPILATITDSPSTATPGINATQLFIATARDQNGAPLPGINITFTSTPPGNVSPVNAITGADGNASTSFMAGAVGTSMVNATNGTVTGSAVVIVRSGMTWQVLAGGETPDMALQGMGFYPGSIIINEGDTIVWTLGGHLVHTVSFLSGAQIPDPGNASVFLPAGGSTYNGTGVSSSGLLTPGMSYSLTFTKQGFYDYRCLIHPGMTGVVIVQPAGSPYPSNQSQYTALGMRELQEDMDTGQELEDHESPETSQGENGITVFHVSADIPLPVNASLRLMPENNSNVTGNAALSFIGVGEMQVQIMVTGLVPNNTYPADIRIGTSEAGGPILYTLGNLTADFNGTGTSTTVITGPPWFAVASRGWFINVHQGPAMEGTGATPIASGDIVKHNAMFARFTPQNLTIHVNDSIVWKQLNFIEIHTVTFPEAGNNPPEFLLPNLTVNPVAATPAGGSIHNGTGFYNSGILNAGDNYTLTFTKPGTYNYVCTIHDNMNMTGNVTVTGRQPPEVEAYDTDNNGIIDKGEAVRAIEDYFVGRTTRVVAIEVVIAYFNH
ncbi:Plastocyanin [uncultured archaeon]|nr:Plastocyanin [uncultured archaeon]